MAGIRLTHVPYKGAGPAAIDLIAGNIQIRFTGAVPALQHARAGKVRTLAVTSPKRSTAMRDVPALAEAGVPGYVMGCRGTAYSRPPRSSSEPLSPASRFFARCRAMRFSVFS